MLTKKSKFIRGFKTKADKQSVSLREELGIKQYEPICAFDLCKHLGIKILTPDKVPEFLQSDINQMDSDLWSAVTLNLGKEKNLIIHNPKHSPKRQQSNLMHEVSHVLCGHKTSNDPIVLMLSGFLRNHNENDENEAEWLGSCLQLPRPALIWALKRGMSLDEITDHYNASIEMVRYRINITGVKKQLQRSKLKYG